MFNTNETCENSLTQSWNLTGLWNFDFPISALCEIDEVGDVHGGNYGIWLVFVFHGPRVSGYLL